MSTKEQAHTAEHTPGPWGMTTVRTSCGVCHKVGPWPHKWRAGTEMSACIYDDYPSPPEGTDTMLANARLIAAAPDLLAALRQMVINSEGDGKTYRDCHKKALAAIDRATGASK